MKSSIDISILLSCNNFLSVLDLPIFFGNMVPNKVAKIYMQYTLDLSATNIYDFFRTIPNEILIFSNRFSNLFLTIF